MSLIDILQAKPINTVADAVELGERLIEETGDIPGIVYYMLGSQFPALKTGQIFAEFNRLRAERVTEPAANVGGPFI